MIPVYEPLFLGNEKKYLNKAIDDGEVSSSGRFVKLFEEKFAEWSGNKYAVTVANGTAALECAIWALDLEDDISVPTGTIISCYIAPMRLNKKVTLRDNIRTEYKNIMKCHLFGHIDYSHGAIEIDDLAQYWKPYKVKNIGCYSLYANKLITSGEGGVVVTNDEKLRDAVISYRNLCHSKNERFYHDDLGYNFRMSNIQAAVSLAQLEQIEKFSEIKRKNRDLYKKYLPEDVNILFDVDVPWMYWISTKYSADKVVTKLKDKGIDCRKFFYPIHRQPCINIYGEYPIADYYRYYSFYLPSGLTLTKKQIMKIGKALAQIVKELKQEK